MNIRQALAAFVIIGGALLLGSVRSQAPGSASGPLIRQVDITRLALPGGFAPRRVRVGRGSVGYDENSTSGPVKWVGVGVYPSVDSAQKAFGEWTTWQIVTRDSSLKVPKIGDFFNYSLGNPGKDGDYKPGPFNSGAGWPGAYVIRRRNVILAFGYAGKGAEAIALAQRLDKQLQFDAIMAPKGDSLRVPQVEITAPQKVFAGQRVPLHFRCRDAAGVRIQGMGPNGAFTSSGDSPLLREGTLWTHAPKKVGLVQRPVQMVSAGNVFFSPTVAINVTPRRFTHWTINGSALYFFQKPDEKAKAFEEQEGMPYNWSGYCGPIDGFDKRQALIARAFAEWKRSIRPEWLPEEDLILFGYVGESFNSGQYVAYATYERKGYHLALRARLGRGFNLYVDQPLPLPSGTLPLGVAAVVHADAGPSEVGPDGEEIYRRAAVAGKAFERYRTAQAVRGKREKVHMLLLRSPESKPVTLSFRTFSQELMGDLYGK